MKVGVLALQGDFREHLAVLAELDVQALAVRTASEINSIDALILPGGESTTIAKLARSFDLFDLIRGRIQAGMPTYGSCAGMILLADRVLDATLGQETFGGIDMTVRRNAFGRQVDSFETELEFSGFSAPAIRALFIRAPWVEDLGSKAEILASVEVAGVVHPVAVRQGHLLATSFHPEISGDNRIHEFFLAQLCSPSRA